MLKKLRYTYQLDQESSLPLEFHCPVCKEQVGSSDLETHAEAHGYDVIEVYPGRPV